MNHCSTHNRLSLSTPTASNGATARVASPAALRGLLPWIVLLCVVWMSGQALALDANATSQQAGTRSQSPISITLKQYKVVKDEKGETQFVDASLVVPGDIIEYRAVYSNRSTSTLPVVATMPIPEAMEYIKESAKAKGKLAHTVATKDSQYAQEPLQFQTKTASGATVSQPVPYASYRFVRWDLGKLPSGGSVEVSVRAKVSQDLEKDATAADKTALQVSSSINK